MSRVITTKKFTTYCPLYESTDCGFATSGNDKSSTIRRTTVHFNKTHKLKELLQDALEENTFDQ